MSYSLKEVQLGFHFPEYEFKEGDIVQHMKYEEYKHIPFMVVRRRFYDERDYRTRAEADNQILTAWFYVIRAVFPDETGYHVTDAVAARYLREWKWELSKQWEL